MCATAQCPRRRSADPESEHEGFSDHGSTLLRMGDTGRNTDARIAVTAETRDRVRSQKRAGETYDKLLQKMVEQYDPDSADVEI